MNFLDRRGLTLIEIMVSVMILLITITGLMTTYTLLNKQAYKMQQKHFALRFAQRKIEEWMANLECPATDKTTYKQQEFTSTLEEIPIDSLPECKEAECNITWIDGNVSLKTIWGN